MLRILAVLALLGLAFATPPQQRFNFQNFDATVRLNLYQSYKQSPYILLTGDTQKQTGAVWFQSPLDISRSFTTQFAFDIQASDSNGADGFAFVMQNGDPWALGLGQSGIGYDSLMHAVAIEFDTFMNPNLGDTNDNHISIHQPGANGKVLADERANNPLLSNYQLTEDLNSGHTYNVKVQYDATGHGLKVYFDGELVKNTTFSIDLHGKLGSDLVWFGFTSGTGGHIQNHHLHSWQFQHESTEACADGFVAEKIGAPLPPCIPDMSNAAAVCGEQPDCMSCTRDTFPCRWDDGCALSTTTGDAGVVSSDKCPKSTSYTWVWILLAVAVVVIGTVITLWYFKRRANSQSVDGSYGYL